MASIEKNLEIFHPQVGFEVSRRFEEQIANAALELAQSLEEKWVDTDVKVNYATHVFAKVLDELADIVDQSIILN